MVVSQGRTSVYRWYDDEGTLLYIGMATDPLARAKQHEASGNQWFLDAHEMKVRWFPARDEAARAEEAGIAAEMPLFNGGAMQTKGSWRPAYQLHRFDRAFGGSSTTWAISLRKSAVVNDCDVPPWWWLDNQLANVTGRPKELATLQQWSYDAVDELCDDLDPLQRSIVRLDSIPWESY